MITDAPAFSESLNTLRTLIYSVREFDGLRAPADQAAGSFAMYRANLTEPKAAITAVYNSLALLARQADPRKYVYSERAAEIRDLAAVLADKLRTEAPELVSGDSSGTVTPQNPPKPPAPGDKWDIGWFESLVFSGVGVLLLFLLWLLFRRRN